MVVGSRKAPPIGMVLVRGAATGVDFVHSVLGPSLRQTLIVSGHCFYSQSTRLVGIQF